MSLPGFDNCNSLKFFLRWGFSSELGLPYPPPSSHLFRKSRPFLPSPAGNNTERRTDQKGDIGKAFQMVLKEQEAAGFADPQQGPLVTPNTVTLNAEL